MNSFKSEQTTTKAYIGPVFYKSITQNITWAQSAQLFLN